MTAHKRARAFFLLFLFFRFTILPDAGTDAVLGQQAHDIWSRELGDARCAALGGCRRRRPGSVRAILALLLLPSVPPPSFLFVLERSTPRLTSFPCDHKQAT